MIKIMPYTKAMHVKHTAINLTTLFFNILMQISSIKKYYAVTAVTTLKF